jgi:hypothetical protein
MKFLTRSQTEATACANAIAEARVVASRELGRSHAELHNALRSLEYVYRHEATEHARKRQSRLRALKAKRGS